MAVPPSETLRILCIDGGGIKGYTSLLILKRIFRTMIAEGQLPDALRPCNVFDLIIGTSTGGLIAVMLGRLHMTIDECIAKYEQVGKEVFGKRPHGGQFGKILKGIRSSPFYDIRILQEEIKKALDSKGIPHDAPFLEANAPLCKVMLCVTRTEISKPDVLRNYLSLHPTTENYNCRIWEAASATAAAPMYFKGVEIEGTGEKWCDGGLRRNNPINEALSEVSRERDTENKKIGCILSLGTGTAKINAISSSLAGFLKDAVAIMADSEDTAKIFATSELGVELSRTNRYFRFSVPQGMQDLQLDEWKETEKMKALTTDYLSHVGSGDQIQQCAKSLLYPDENLQVVIKPKRSIMPYQPCTHFVERRLYSDKLFAFFKVNKEFAQIFVLWGLGGVGKTQIALKFAQSMRHRVSIFWIRADRLTNFAADYTQILNELDPIEGGHDRSTAGLATTLDRTRRKLEEISSEWLLILDNADDLDSFLGKPTTQGDDDCVISRFIPRRGRILITTRDRRFQGAVAAANNGIKLELMADTEAEDLLIKSIPGYLIKDEAETMQHAKKLLKELGYLPLAIAQAAANILEQQLTLVEYVNFYNDKKHRMGLMQAPVCDFQNTDPQNASQSVHVTWQVSFDILRERFPLSAIFLSYIGCFHWRNIPRILLQRLPEFRNLENHPFIQLTKKPLNLSLVEEIEENEPGFTEYSVHPLVHDNIIGHLSVDDIRRYLEPAIEVLSDTFPFIYKREDTVEWSLAAYLAPHAIRQVELAGDIEMSSKSLARLLLILSCFLGESNMFNVSADLAKRSLFIAAKEWGPDAFQTDAHRCNAVGRYCHAHRFEEAEHEARYSLMILGSDSMRAAIDETTIEKKRINYMSLLSSCLDGLHRNQEREEIHRKQLESDLVDVKGHQGVTIKHNLAHSIFHQGRLSEAKAINDELVNFCETDEGKAVVDPRLHTILLNLKASILRQGGFAEAAHNGFVQMAPLPLGEEQERLQIHELVFQISMEKLGIEDVDTWKAANNLTGYLSEMYRMEELGSVLRKVLPVGITAQIRAEGSLQITLQDILNKAGEYLDYLTASKGSNDITTTEFKVLLDAWTVSCGFSQADMPPDYYNSRGVYLQRKGQFQEAEINHRQVIDALLRTGVQVDDIYWYNLMLAIGRQGRIEDALAFREEHREELSRAEIAFGALETRVERDRTDYDIYRQAHAMFSTGQLSRQDEWWLINQKALLRAEYRYGYLDIEKLSNVAKSKLPQNVGSKAEQDKKHSFWMPFRSKGKPN